MEECGMATVRYRVTLKRGKEQTVEINPEALRMASKASEGDDFERRRVGLSIITGLAVKDWEMIA